MKGNSMTKVSTIVDSDGDVWTGREESKGPDVMDLVVGIVCPPMLPVLLGDNGKTTVVVNDERHTGKRVR